MSARRGPLPRDHVKTRPVRTSHGSSLTSKKRQKMVADETSHLQQVLQHPAFVADPFAALQEHIRNTVGAMHQNEPKYKKKKPAAAAGAMPGSGPKRK